ncbi:MAG: hypothetical protein ACD_3C00154G0014 [uncultured bacterium (gcode 4)]|uniref:Barstar (barnase inhibitor) domain-containing protein n=1 Tax=uncultured bacterium (gcode 4) TaxID=1234023 RepID=K2F9H4_9BACT|nr:MAG: hypothetical protein ACD_3C00154G0014 [uncultured bacterium (gcode 4)]
MEEFKTRIIEFNQVNNKEELFDKISILLDFPDHFWGNWDALYDCLTDMSWSGHEKIILFHKRSFKLDEEDFKIYMNIWDETVKYWLDNGHVPFEVIYSQCPYCND